MGAVGIGGLSFSHKDLSLGPQSVTICQSILEVGGGQFT